MRGIIQKAKTLFAIPPGPQWVYCIVLARRLKTGKAERDRPEHLILNYRTAYEEAREKHSNAMRNVWRVGYSRRQYRAIPRDTGIL